MRLPRDIEQELESTGRCWDVQRGSRHWKIVVGGKLVGILPLNLKLGDARARKNVVSQIRRAGRG